MKKINNIHDLRYRKLFLRSEIRIKENKIKNQVSALRTEIKQADFKNEFIQSIMNNPATIVNTARISYQIVKFIKKHRNKRRAKKA